MSLTIDHSERAVRGSRVRWLSAIGLTLAVACVMRLIFLQLIRGAELAQASENNRTQILVERAPRGRIVDREGKILADDRPVFVALFSPLGVSLADLQNLVGRLSPILNVPPLELDQRFRQAIRMRSMLRVSDQLSRTQAFLLLQDRVHLPGISLSVEEQRTYPQGRLASHILGYVGMIAEHELEDLAEQGYRAGDWIGKSGVERVYDSWLHGVDGGYLLEVDARGRQVRVIRRLTPQPGRDLQLTLNAALQKLAEDRLRSTGRPGAVVVLNPKNGEVLALASAPGFDPNVFLPLGNSQSRLKLLKDPDRPLLNRAIQGAYPPGSVFKVVTALAALDRPGFRPDERILCTGVYVFGRENRPFRCWKPNGHGLVDLKKALARSCDVYFYQAGLKVGPEALEQWAKECHLGRLTGIDLPSERKGLLPLTFHLSRRQYWMGGQTLNYAIGQGALQTTPLQVALLTSAVANRGALWRPYLVRGVEEPALPGGLLSLPHRLAQIKAGPEAWRRLEEGLIEVVASGTGVAGQINGVIAAGKTGTAQIGRDKEHAWFMEYAPVGNPQVACAVLVENAGHGGVAAAPVARDLVALALGVRAGPAPQAVQGD